MKRFRLAVIILGVALSLAALRFNDPRVTWAAIAVLALALGLRFLMPRPGAGESDSEPPHPDDPSASS